MKNIDIKNGDNLEEILKNENLPIMINNEIVIMDYNEYIKQLKEIDALKAEEIIKNIEFAKYMKYFTDEVLEKLKETLLSIFGQLKEQDFSNKEKINQIISTSGYYLALRKTLENNNADNFFAWYDSLDYEVSDEFDSLIQNKLIKKGE